VGGGDILRVARATDQAPVLLDQSVGAARLEAAPDFKPTEKTVYMRAREQATDLGRKAANKASELKDKAAQKIEDMRSKSNESR